MQLEHGHLYHIFNQGNNKQPVFYEHDNYIFFLNKMRTHLLPHCNIIAWCLMPNHFHWMIEIKDVDVPISYFTKSPDTLSQGMTQSHTLTNQHNEKKRSINENIGILLRSYTRALNKRYSKSGSIFRKETKAECLTSIDKIQPVSFTTRLGSIMNTSFPEEEYPQRCFEYIHNNPVSAGLVDIPENWKYSSYIDYKDSRSGTLINKERAKLYVA